MGHELVHRPSPQKLEIMLKSISHLEKQFKTTSVLDSSLLRNFWTQSKVLYKLTKLFCNQWINFSQKVEGCLGLSCSHVICLLEFAGILPSLKKGSTLEWLTHCHQLRSPANNDGKWLSQKCQHHWPVAIDTPSWKHLACVSQQPIAASYLAIESTSVFI